MTEKKAERVRCFILVSKKETWFQSPNTMVKGCFSSTEAMHGTGIMYFVQQSSVVG